MRNQNRVRLLGEAQEKLQEVINMLEVACKGDSNADSYLIAYLKISASQHHSYLSRDLNIDELIDRYSDSDYEDISYEEIEQFLD